MLQTLTVCHCQVWNMAHLSTSRAWTAWSLSKLCFHKGECQQSLWSADWSLAWAGFPWQQKATFSISCKVQAEYPTRSPARSQHGLLYFPYYCKHTTVHCAILPATLVWTKWSDCRCTDWHVYCSLMRTSKDNVSPSRRIWRVTLGWGLPSPVSARRCSVLLIH